MQSPVASACTVVFVIATGFFATGKLCMLREEYLKQAIIIEKDWDFLQKCETAEGYANMNHHPNFCENIMATARIGAFWHAVNKVAGSLPFEDLLAGIQKVSWQLLAVLAVACLVFPSLVISQLRFKQERLPMHSPYNEYGPQVYVERAPHGYPESTRVLCAGAKHMA